MDDNPVVARRFAALVFAWLTISLVAAAPASTSPGIPNAAGSDDTSQAELEQALAALLASPWERTLALRFAVGYRDNVLLSPFTPVGRMFVQSEIDGFVWRLPLHRWECVGFLNADVSRYISAPAETGGEQHWLGHAEIRWLPSDPWRVGLAADAYYEDRVMDLSETEAVREVVPTRTEGLMLTASGRILLPANFSFAPSVQVHRSDFRDYPGDYDEGKVGAQLEWKRWKGFSISTGWFEKSRSYAERPQFTAGGRALPGTRLRFRQKTGDVKVMETWEAQGRWTISITGSGLENRDGASGYFNYREKRATLEVVWEGKTWRISVRGDAKRRDYLVQTVGLGINPPRRVEDDHEVGGRLEKKVSEKWMVYLAEHWERSRSNEIDFNYRANTSTIGVQYTY